MESYLYIKTELRLSNMKILLFMNSLFGMNFCVKSKSEMVLIMATGNTIIYTHNDVFLFNLHVSFSGGTEKMIFR